MPQNPSSLSLPLQLPDGAKTNRLGLFFRVGLLLLSFLYLCSLINLNSQNVRASVGEWSTDHFSHWGSTLLFSHVGWDLYRRPVRELCAESDAAAVEFAIQLELNPADSCQIPGEINKRPVMINWQDFPRPYPPGVFLYSLPEALLWRFTGISMHQTNRFTVTKYLLVAHFSVFMAWMVLFPIGRRLKSMAALPRAAQWVVIPMLYFELVFWSISGIYDAAAVLFGFLALLFLGRSRPAWAVFASCSAVFLHFRALWFAPALVLIGLWELWRSGALNRLSSSVWGPLALGGGIAGLSAYSFLIVRPWLSKFPLTNPVRWDPALLDTPDRLSLMVVAVLAALYFVSIRAWLLGTTAAWQVLMILQTPQIQGWHSLSFLPLIGLGLWRREDSGPAVAFVAMYLVQTIVVFHKAPLPGMFFSQMLRGEF